VQPTGVSTDWLNNNIFVGDFDGDGSEEIIGRGDISGNWLLLDFDEQLGTTLQTDFGFSLNDPQFQDAIYVGDVNRDGRDDLIGKRSGPGWNVGITVPVSGNTFKQDPATNWGTWFDATLNPDGSPDADGPYRNLTETFASVYNNVELEAYRGIRKGPTATLQTGRGNAWDQAVALAESLDDIYNATITTGRITAPLQTVRLPIGWGPSRPMRLMNFWKPLIPPQSSPQPMRHSITPGSA